MVENIYVRKRFCAGEKERQTSGSQLTDFYHLPAIKKKGQQTYASYW